MSQILCTAYLNKQYKVRVHASLHSCFDGLALSAVQLLGQGVTYVCWMHKNKYMPMVYAYFEEAYLKENNEDGINKH